MPPFTVHIPVLKGQSPALLSALQQSLVQQGLSLHTDSSAAASIVTFEPGNNLQELTSLISDLHQDDRKIILCSTQQSIPERTQWNLLAAGADDIVQMQQDREQTCRQVAARLRRWKQIEEILCSDEVRNKLIGESSTWKNFLRRVIEAACYTKGNILITGASGTGKELTAGLVHQLDQREKKGQLVLLDCTTIVPELFGSEFYGHEKGAFTSSSYAREGAFSVAKDGTLFLDELGELPLQLQAGLLRVIQEKTFKKVGSNLWQKTNFRLVCATNRDLKSFIREGRFREDLYYRVAGAVFHIPPLDERKEDIPELTRYFLREELNCLVAPVIDPAVMNFLVNRNYPGNVRELRQLVAAIALRYTGEDCITLGDLPDEERINETAINATPGQSMNIRQTLRIAIAAGKDLATIKNEIASLAMEAALEECNGNLKMAARILNVDVRTLQYIRSKNGGTSFRTTTTDPDMPAPV